METNLTPEYIQKIWDNKRVRQRLAFESPFWFSLLYLRHHFNYPLAPFHMEMFRVIEDHQYDFVVVMAFRGSGKSTIMNMANTLWSVLGKPQKKFVIIMSKSQDQAKNHFSNIKHELEINELLKEDFGPFQESPEEWRKTSLELVYRDSKIISVSRDQSIRGLKYGSFRSDLIICDDIEDISDKGKGDAVYEQFAHEVLPIGSANTRIVVLGNLLDKYSLMVRLREDVKQKTDGIFLAYPIVDAYQKVLWPQKFSNKISLKELKEKTPSATWVREYLLDAATEVSYGESRESSPRMQKCMKRGRPYWKPIRDIELQYRKAREKAGEIVYQKPLVRQMKRFSIEAPIVKSHDNHWEPVSNHDAPHVREYKIEINKAWEALGDVVSECLKDELRNN